MTALLVVTIAAMVTLAMMAVSDLRALVRAFAAEDLEAVAFASLCLLVDVALLAVLAVEMAVA